ncbi:MAG: hypothetical protein P4L59_08085 [Desulfosporosinus sp.]|nr:hypothetical protein [Desulfosporosinus sp.]
MTVKELIKILQSLENQNATIVLKDSAAGTREIKEIEDVFGFHYIMQPMPTKRKKGKI